MIKTAHILSVLALLCTVAGCGQPSVSRGAGFGGSVAGNKSSMYAYGYDKDEKLAYVIFSDLDNAQTIGSVSSGLQGRSGSFQDKRSGSTIRYEATDTGIDIHGTSYDFAAGRVFLLSTADDATSVTQLDIPFSGVAYEAELKTLESQSAVKEFRDKADAR